MRVTWIALAAGLAVAEIAVASPLARGAESEAPSGGAATYLESIVAKARDLLENEPRDPALAAELLMEAANANDPAAMILLAQLYAKGDGVERDYATAETLLNRAADAGRKADASIALAELYRAAEPPFGDPAKAVDAYQAAVSLGNTGAMVSLGRMLGTGDGVPVDFPRARQLLEDAIAGGAEKDGWAALAALYANAGEANRDMAKAAEAYQHAADLGDAWAMLSLAQMLTQGNGVPADYERARALLDRAIAAGGEMPQSAWAGIGDLYRVAAPPYRDPQKAVEAYETAISLGNTAAMVSLARMLGSGDGVPVDFPRARQLLEDAIAGGAEKDGWAALAALYANADGADRDMAKAAEAYQHAADLGDAWAMLSLAQMLAQGDGIPADYDRARTLLDQAVATGGEMPQWAWAGIGDLYRVAAPPYRDPAKAVEAYETAISLGNAGAMVSLARMLGTGDGVPVDFPRARQLLEDAIAAGVEKDGWAALASLYAYSDDANRDLPKAAEAFQNAADRGDPWSMIGLAQMLAQGNGGPADYERARALLDQAIATGGGMPQWAWAGIGDLYRVAAPPYRDPAKAVEAYETAISLGNTGAMVSLARMLGAGDGVPVDFPRARQLLEDAIAAGAEKDGWAALASLYANADEADRDMAKAAEAYQHAADLGDAWAMLSLAQILAQGDGIPADYDRARGLLDQAVASGGEMPQWAWAGIGALYRVAAPPYRDPAKAVEAYESAISLGNTGAMVSLARMLGTGDGVPVDFPRARQLLEDAIAGGVEKDGWAALASLYAYSDDANRDLPKAAEAFQNAADRGDAWSMIGLAQMLAQGNGVPADFARAVSLLDQAIAAGLAGPAGKAAGDLYATGPEENRDLAKALSYYQLASAAGDGSAGLAVAEIQAGSEGPAQAQASIADHLASATKLLGASEVAKAMFNVSPPSSLYVMVQALLVDLGYKVTVDGIYGAKSQQAVTSFCQEKQIAPCPSRIVAIGVLTELLNSVATGRQGA